MAVFLRDLRVTSAGLVQAFVVENGFPVKNGESYFVIVRQQVTQWSKRPLALQSASLVLSHSRAISGPPNNEAIILWQFKARK
jgi:hypothetical protein